MDSQSQARLDEICSKEVAALTESDKDFLRARSSYLSDENRLRYAEVLGEDRPSAGTTEPQGGVNPDPNGQPAETPLEEMSKAELSAVAEGLGLEPAGTFESKASVIERINAAKASSQTS